MPPRTKPPWWPDDEPFPPERWGPGAWGPGAWGRGGRSAAGPDSDGDAFPGWGQGSAAWGPWRHGRSGGRRGGFARRIGCFIVLVGLVLASVGVLVLFLLGSLLGVVAGGPLPEIAGPAGIVGILLGVVALVATVRVFRSISTPLGDLGDAAGRLESGDYSVRVDQPERAPGELRSLVTAFNTMAARMESEDATRRRLLADISHELRTPLAVIQGNLEALLDGVYPADEAHVRPILEETRVLERLVDDLRTLSLAESGALPLHREPTDPAVLVEDVVAAHRPRAAAARVDIRAEVAPDAGSVDLDPVRMRQVISNLVDNAIRAMPDGGSIAIVAARRGTSLTIDVTDDGPGIPAELRASVFERFTKSPASRGSGLGLAIARAIVTAHGGTIEAGPGPGPGPGPGARGTTIRIVLPLG